MDPTLPDPFSDMDHSEFERRIRETDRLLEDEKGGEAGAGQDTLLDTFMQGVNRDMNETRKGKLLRERVKRVELVHGNPNVYRFSGAKTPASVMKAAQGPSKKKPADQWIENRYAYATVGWVDNVYPIFGYVYDGKNNEFANEELTSLKCFLPMPRPQVPAFHDPNENWLAHAKDTSVDACQEVKLTSKKNNKTFVSYLYDARHVVDLALKAVKKANPAPAATKAAGAPATNNKKKKKKDQDDGKNRGLYETVHLPFIAASFDHLHEIQNRVGPENVGVYLESSPTFAWLKARVGADVFPRLRSEQVDGLFYLPRDFDLDLSALYETIWHPLAHPESPMQAQWATTALMQAIVVNGMMRQYEYQPVVSFLHQSGRVLNEEENEKFFKTWSRSDKGNYAMAKNIYDTTLVRDMVDLLLDTDSPVLTAAKDFIAFTRAALRIASITPFAFPVDDDTGVSVRSALTGAPIVPGQPLYLIHGKSYQTEQAPLGLEMIAIVEQSCITELCPLRALTISKNKKKTEEAEPAAEPVPAKLTEDQKREAKNARKRIRAQELRDKKKAEAEAAAVAKPESDEEEEEETKTEKTPKSKPTPQVENHSSPKKHRKPAPKKTKGEPAPTVNPYLAVHPLLEKHGLVLDANALFLALGQLGTIDVEVNTTVERTTAALDQITVPPTVWGGKSLQNMQVLSCLVNTACAFFKPLTALSAAEREQIGPEVADPMLIDEEFLGMMADSLDPDFLATSSATVKTATLTAHAALDDLIQMRCRRTLGHGKYFDALYKVALPLQLDVIVAEFKPIATGSESQAKVRLGEMLACFKWLFPAPV